jgi:hypothetical protein
MHVDEQYYRQKRVPSSTTEECAIPTQELSRQQSINTYTLLFRCLMSIVLVAHSSVVKLGIPLFLQGGMYSRLGMIRVIKCSNS